MSDELKKWRVKGKQGGRPLTTIVTTPTKEKAEDYAKFRASERGKGPLEIIETVEKKKGKKP